MTDKSPESTETVLMPVNLPFGGGSPPQPEQPPVHTGLAGENPPAATPASTEGSASPSAAPVHTGLAGDPNDLPPPPADETVMIDALKEVIDPELMINIVDLGLIYNITLDERTVHIDMTLTSPACPAGPQIVQQSKMAIEKLPGIEKANIRLVMSPPWSPARMTDEARDLLGIF
jgi:metal-sulfur cluster biosynthetic enzyme